MFLSAVQTYVIAIIVSIVVLQYAFALFCLLKLAYFDISRNEYILWNVFILIVFFIGGGVFLFYYFKHPEKRLAKSAGVATDSSATDGTQDKTAQDTEQPSADVESQEQSDSEVNAEANESAETVESDEAVEQNEK
ncbi:MAG: hypothetical protein J1G01_06225 [Clostridiales bacterium]|nr:hypothetical protein [Clostridiales bacterium]